MNKAELDNERNDENRLIVERRARLAELRDQGQAFPNDFRRTHYCEALQQSHGARSREDVEQDQIQVAVAGRVMLNRGAFIVIQDSSGRLQLYVNRKKHDTETLAAIKRWDLGDIVAATGVLCKSNKGDLYVDMDAPRLLVKSLRPLPDKHKGLADTEMKYRQRYLDLITDETARNRFRVRSKVIEGVRRFLGERDFLEAETPMLQTLPGGAAARPFKTFHNALDMPMYLRIAPELFLKRLVVGGFERVFEINRNFRNEGLSTRHNPEFTMLEFYQAYATYEDLMDLTEEMLRYVARFAIGSTRITLASAEQQSASAAIPGSLAPVPAAGGEHVAVDEGAATVLDFDQPFRRMTVLEAILTHNPQLDGERLTERAYLESVAADLGIAVQDGWGEGRLQIEIFEATAEHRLIEPTFITAYPTEVSPLARRNDRDPTVTDRFELFIGGREIANGFSELNDPEDQAERFRKQVESKEAGDQEAMFFDADYITALEHGLPPTAGEGIGIDRLVMLLTGVYSIRDVILFPHMRPRGGAAVESQTGQKAEQAGQD